MKKNGITLKNKIKKIRLDREIGGLMNKLSTIETEELRLDHTIYSTRKTY